MVLSYRALDAEGHGTEYWQPQTVLCPDLNYEPFAEFVIRKTGDQPPCPSKSAKNADAWSSPTALS